jgi:membrane protease YdiL (CAAX protease family)
MYSLASAHRVEETSMLDDTPVRLLAMLGLAALAVWAFAAAGVVSVAIARAVSAGAAQGALLAWAVAWTITRGERVADVLPLGIALTALAGALAVTLAPAGAFAYLLAPLWLWRRRSRLRGLGLEGTPSARLLLAGFGLGAVLGGHLMLTASLTLGYRIVRPTAVELGPWLAYDLGANVLAAECFFRGALFDRAQRRWPFAAATTLSTVACVVRYLVDPLLPRSLEVLAGAAFYVTLLSVGNCWLYWRTGSVIPGLAAGCVFFAVYRLLDAVR